MSSVDVIVPCYRYGRFLRECVESVLAESALHVRVLIIDDASPDNTAEVAIELAKGDSRVTFLRHVMNKGHIATYNEGIEWVSADYMLLLSADDYLLPGALRRSANLMDIHPEIGFTYGKAVELWGDGATRQTNTTSHIGDKGGWSILGGLEFIKLIERSGLINIVSTPTAVVRTELQKRVGGYRHELPHSGDLEMWLRLSAYASVGVLEAHQAVYRRHGANMCMDYYKEGCLLDLYQRKAALDCFFQACSNMLPNAQQLRSRLLRGLSCEAVGLASMAINEGKLEVSEQLSDYALKLCPEVKQSLRWARLACKRRLGSRAWRILQPIVAGIRKWGRL